MGLQYTVESWCHQRNPLVRRSSIKVLQRRRVLSYLWSSINIPGFDLQCQRFKSSFIYIYLWIRCWVDCHWEPLWGTYQAVRVERITRHGLLQLWQHIHFVLCEITDFVPLLRWSFHHTWYKFRVFQHWSRFNCCYQCENTIFEDLVLSRR